MDNNKATRPAPAGDALKMIDMSEDVAATLKALSHPARLKICCRLRHGEMSVGDMETTLDIRQPNLSRELAKLRAEGIVDTRRESKVVFYHLADGRMERIIDALCLAVLDTDCPNYPAAAGATTPDQPSPRTGGYGVFATTRPAAPSLQDPPLQDRRQP